MYSSGGTLTGQLCIAQVERGQDNYVQLRWNADRTIMYSSGGTRTGQLCIPQVERGLDIMCSSGGTVLDLRRNLNS